jgi:hypothetical protein
MLSDTVRAFSIVDLVLRCWVMIRGVSFIGRSEVVDPICCITELSVGFTLSKLACGKSAACLETVRMMGNGSVMASIARIYRGNSCSRILFVHFLLSTWCFGAG